MIRLWDRTNLAQNGRLALQAFKINGIQSEHWLYVSSCTSDEFVLVGTWLRMRSPQSTTNEVIKQTVATENIIPCLFVLLVDFLSPVLFINKTYMPLLFFGQHYLCFWMLRLCLSRGCQTLRNNDGLDLIIWLIDNPASTDVSSMLYCKTILV